MARAETASTRLPRGAGSVTKAFFAALDAVPETMQATVAKAAQGAIRDELKRREEKQRNAARAARMTVGTEPRGRAAASARAGTGTGTGRPRGRPRLHPIEDTRPASTPGPKPRGRRRMAEDMEAE